MRLHANAALSLNQRRRLGRILANARKNGADSDLVQRLSPRSSSCSVALQASAEILTEPVCA
jgi:hypothetical protein